MLMLVTRCISPDEARKSTELNVLLLIACTFGIGTALEKTGAAALIAEGIITIFSQFGNVGILAGLYLVTILFSAIITNNATPLIHGHLLSLLLLQHQLLLQHRSRIRQT